MRASECYFHLVLLVRLFTHSQHAKIQWLTRSKPLKLEMVVGDFSGGYLSNDWLMIGSYVCGLNSELFLHTDKNHIFLLEANKCRKSFAF